MNFCPECGAKLVSQKFCAECGENISKYLDNASRNAESAGGIGSFDFSALEHEAKKQLEEQIGLQIEGSVLVKYTGKSRDVVIPNGTTEIFDGAFENNEIIASVEIPEGVKVIGKNAFRNCRYLKKVNIPSTVEEIYENAFDGCKELDGITLPPNITRIRTCAFNACTSLTSIKIPEGVTEIEDSAFCGCNALEDVSMPYGLAKIGKSAFSSCNSLKALLIPDSVTCILENAFYGCRSVKDVILPSGIKGISRGLFYSCDELVGVTIPRSVEYINAGAFYNCQNLKKVNYTGTAEDWLGINVHNNSLYGSSSPLSYAKALYINGELVTEVTVSTLTSIPRYAFDGWSSLEKVTIGENVTSIGDFAFRGCTGLKEITISNSVVHIGNAICSGCTALQSLTLPFIGERKRTAEEAPQYPFGYTFGWEAYEGGAETAQRYISSCWEWGSYSPRYNDYRAYIPSSLKSLTVNGGAFLYGALWNCQSLTSLYIGNDVTDIVEYNSIYGCTNLKTIYAPKRLASKLKDSNYNALAKIITY